MDVVAPIKMDRSLVLAYKEQQLQRVVHSLPVLLEIVEVWPVHIELYLLVVGLDEIAIKKYMYCDNSLLSFVKQNYI